MKKILAFSLLMALAVCSCQDKVIVDITPEPQPEDIVFTATIENSTQWETKTSLDENWNVLWTRGDQVSIFAGSTVNGQYQVTDDSDGKSSANLYQISDGFVAGKAIDNNVAFYPYTPTASIVKSEDTYIISNFLLPEYQVYDEASFGNGAFPMAAVTGSTGEKNLNFKNILGGLMLQLKGSATIATIRIIGNNQEILCGNAEVTVSSGSVPSINLKDASATTVTMDCGAGVTLNSDIATSFIIALPPMTFSKGFSVLFTDKEGNQMEIVTKNTLTISRSHMLKMETIDYVGLPVSVSQITNGSILVFRAGGKVRIEKTSQTEQISIPPDIDWITEDAVVGNCIILDVLNNPYQESRYADVIITGQEGDIVLRIVQFGEKFRLTIAHTVSRFSVMDVDWGSNTSYNAAVLWGDGCADVFVPALHHEYSNNGASKRVDICSDVLPETIVFNDVKGINHIDLSYFQSNE